MQWSEDHQPEERGRTGPLPGCKPSQTLTDLRWVYRHPLERPGSVMRQVLQRMLRESPEKFLALLEKHEDKHQAKVEAARERLVERGEGEVDPGTEAVLTELAAEWAVYQEWLQYREEFLAWRATTG